MRIGFLLFITACSKYSSRSTMGLSYSIREGSAGVYHSLGLGGISELRCDQLCTVYNNDGRTVLCRLIEIGSVVSLQECLESIKNDPKSDLNKVVSLIAGYGRKIPGMEMPLLIRAVKLGHLEITKLLFETLHDYGLDACRHVFSVPFGAPPEFRIPGQFVESKFTIIHQAIWLSNFKLVKYLTNKYIEIENQKAEDLPSKFINLKDLIVTKNRNDFPLLDLALQKCGCKHSNSLNIWQHLLQYADAGIVSHMQGQYRSVLHAAVKCGDREGLKNMIDAIKEGVKTNHRQDDHIIDQILNLSDQHDRTLLHYAVLCRQFGIVQDLMALGASATCFNKDKISPLFIAISCYDLDMVKWLLQLECAGKASLQSNINHPGNAKLTPLNFSVSCSTGKLPCTTLRDLNWVLGHESPFIEETKGIMSEISQALLGVGADPYIRDIFDEAPLCKAAEMGNADSVALLLDARVDPCRADKSGRTPLHKAAKTGNADSVALLLNAGGNPLAEDVQRYTPLDIAFNQIQVRPSSEYDTDNRIKLSAFILHAAATLRDPDGVGVKPPINLWMDIRSNFRYGNHKGQRDRLNQLLHCFVLDQCGVSVQSGSQRKGEKRSWDDLAVSYTSLKNMGNRKNVDPSVLSVCSRTFGTCLDIPQKRQRNL